MEVHNVERRLAAILAADVVGYSRLWKSTKRERSRA
jgi:class 3 adenylate cyclase